MVMFSNIFDAVEALENNLGASKQITGATQTDILSIGLGEGQTMKIEAKITARKSDGTKNASFDLGALLYRNTGGNVTLEGNVQELDSHVTAGCAYAATIEANLVTAGAFVTGVSYRIVSAGDTDFISIGAADNNVGTVFTATGAGSGTGTATDQTVDIKVTGTAAETVDWQVNANYIII